MRFFCKIPHSIHISRCLSYHAPICRPHRLLHGSCKQWKKICSTCVCWQQPPVMELPPSMPTMIQVQFYSQRSSSVFTLNTNVDMLRKRVSFSGTPGEDTGSIIPVGVIMPDAKGDNQIKIVIVPLDVTNQNAESLKNTLQAINQLRKHSAEIDAFTNGIMNGTINESELAAVEQNVAKNVQDVDVYESVDAVALATTGPSCAAPTKESQMREPAVSALKHNLAVGTQADVMPISPAPSSPTLPTGPAPMPMSPNTSPNTSPQTQPGVLPLGDPKETQISASKPEPDSHLEEISIDVPQGLGDRLNEMAISSMQLSFEMDMSNVRDAVLYGDVPDKMKPAPSLGKEPMVYLETKVEVDSASAPEYTVPLHFNALIKGTVEINAEKLNPEQLTDERLPQYNDMVTSIAANLCSTALQRSLSPEQLTKAVSEAKGNAAAKPPINYSKISGTRISPHARMALKRHQAQKHMKISRKQPTMSALVAPQQVQVVSPSLKDGCKYPIIKPKRKCVKKCPLDDPCKEDPCKRPQKKTKKKKSVQTTQITMAAKGGKNPCKKAGAGGAKKADPCAKKGGKDGKDKKKADPCAKFKKGGKDGKDKKKADPCAKKGGKDGKGAKKDPCAKFKKGGKDGKDKKKADPCAKFKKGGKDGKDKKKADPCAKFKKGGKDGKDKKKADPCAKKKADPCAKKKKADPCAKKKKADPCAKKGGKGGKGAKKDPCAKFKKGGKDGKGKKKADPCAKFKKGGKGGKGGKGAKKDPCAKFKKGGAKKADPCKKKYSTYASPVSKFYQSSSSLLRNPLSKHFMSTLVKSMRSRRLANAEKATSSCTPAVKRMSAPRFAVYSMLVRRHYGGAPSAMQMRAWGLKVPNQQTQTERSYAKKAKNSKCAALSTKLPSNRKNKKNKKQVQGLRTDCFAQGDADECTKAVCSGKCDTVKFPRKKCERGQKKKKPIKAKKIKKKLPAICASLNKEGKSKERNKLLTMSSLTLKQIRMHSDLSLGKKRYVSQVTKAAVEEHYPEENPSSTTMEVIQIPASYQISRVKQPRPVLKQFDVLIRTGSVALTGSDIHVYENANRDLEGMTLGHDATGFVEEVGSCVHNLHVGDRVVMESALACGICDYCKQGLYNICADLVYNGFLTSHQSHPADLCHVLPDSVSMEEGALTQTLAIGCQACFKANIIPTSNILVIGSTPTAVTAAMCASAIGAKKVTIAGTMDSPLNTISKDFGINTIHFDSNALFCEVLESIYSKFKEWPNCVINCAITPMTMNLAVMALQPCSVCVLAECEAECASFNALDILMKNIRLIPSFRSANMYPTALQLMKSGRAPMRNFIAGVYPWSKLEDAFKCAQHESNVGLRKIIVNSTEEFNIGGLLKNKLKQKIDQK